MAGEDGEAGFLILGVTGMEMTNVRERFRGVVFVCVFLFIFNKGLNFCVVQRQPCHQVVAAGRTDKRGRGKAQQRAPAQKRTSATRSELQARVPAGRASAVAQPLPKRGRARPARRGKRVPSDGPRAPLQ